MIRFTFCFRFDRALPLPLVFIFVIKLRSDVVWQELIVAGTDSSTVSTEWAMAELMRSPTSMMKIREELAKEIKK